MQLETARRLLAMLLRHGQEQNDILLELAEQESDDEFAKIKSMIGQTMGSLYSDAIRPILAEHPVLTPSELKRPR